MTAHARWSSASISGEKVGRSISDGVGLYGGDSNPSNSCVSSAVVDDSLWVNVSLLYDCMFHIHAADWSEASGGVHGSHLPVVTTRERIFAS